MRTGDGACTSAQRDAWDRMFVEHHARVLATCRAILRHPEEAEDAAQEVFVRAAAELAAIADARPWLTQVARNVSIDTLRRRSRRRTVPFESAGALRADIDVQGAIVDRLLAHWLLAQLPPRERLSLVYQLVLDLPLETVAERLRISYAMAAKLASRARRRSRSALAAA